MRSGARVLRENLSGNPLPKAGAMARWYNPDGAEFYCQIPAGEWLQLLIRDGEVEIVDGPPASKPVTKPALEGTEKKR